MQSTPVFDDPTYLSVPMSIAITLICGKLGAIIAVYFKLPPIIGFLLAGLGIQNILNPMFLKGAGFPFPSPASELKLVALIIVLMRAGLSIKFDEIYATAIPTVFLCTLPYLAEFFMWMYVGQTIFNWDTIAMGLWASVMAPLGPSVVISGLLLLLGSKKKDYGYPTKQILISTPIEAVLAIVFFGIFQNLSQTERSTLYPWVKPLPLYENALLVPVNILFSIVLGIVVGFLCSKYIDWRSQITTDFIWVRVNKNPQMGSSTADLVFVLLVLCYTMYSLCNIQYIQQCSGVLVVFTTCITVSILANPSITVDLAQGLKSIWIFAEVFLFTLTGTSLSFDSHNGPLYGERGLAPEEIKKVIGMMFLGTVGRFFIIMLITGILYFQMPPHRKNWKWMLSFGFVCWIFQLPKATVQATLGSVAYYQHVLPGEEGLKQGLLIAQATAFTVLIFAPLGAILTNYVGAPIAEYLTKLDKEAGWRHNEFRYSRTSPYYTGTDKESAPTKSSSVDESEINQEKIEEGKLHEHETIVDLVQTVMERARRNTVDSQQNDPGHSRTSSDAPGMLTGMRRNTLDAFNYATSPKSTPDSRPRSASTGDPRAASHPQHPVFPTKEFGNESHDVEENSNLSNDGGISYKPFQHSSVNSGPQQGYSIIPTKELGNDEHLEALQILQTEEPKLNLKEATSGEK